MMKEWDKDKYKWKLDGLEKDTIYGLVFSLGIIGAIILVILISLLIF